MDDTQKEEEEEVKYTKKKTFAKPWCGRSIPSTIKSN